VVATFALRFGLAALATNVPLAGSFVRIALPLSASSGEPLFGPVLNHRDECVYSAHCSRFSMLLTMRWPPERRIYGFMALL
jgi:hypothetical protein